MLTPPRAGYTHPRVAGSAKSGANGRARVVTIGGGHGQAAVLAALASLDCDIVAIVSVADDGGCSGLLRRELGMAPPGDVRRCLTALARDRELAKRFESRLRDNGFENRCAGNLALCGAYHAFGSLQRAVDWAALALGCVGRVVPAAELPGLLMVYDRSGGPLAGETTIAHASRAPLAAMVHGPGVTNPAAIEAIVQAHYIFIGPGSFITSTLATLTTGDIAEAIVASRACRVLLTNLAPEGDQTAGFHTIDYARMVRDHITIASIGGAAELQVLAHRDGPPCSFRLADGTMAYAARLALPGSRVHAPRLTAAALRQRFGFSKRPHMPPIAGDLMAWHHATFERFLDQGRHLVASCRAAEPRRARNG